MQLKHALPAGHCWLYFSCLFGACFCITMHWLTDLDEWFTLGNFPIITHAIATQHGFYSILLCIQALMSRFILSFPFKLHCLLYLELLGPISLHCIYDINRWAIPPSIQLFLLYVLCIDACIVILCWLRPCNMVWHFLLIDLLGEQLVKCGVD